MIEEWTQGRYPTKSGGQWRKKDCLHCNYVCSYVPLRLLIQVAHDVSPRQISGSQSVLREKFDVEAKAPADAIGQSVPIQARNQRFQLMLQELLQDRFKLIVHRESKEFSLYALVVAKNGPKLIHAPDRDCTLIPSPCHKLPGGPASGLTGQAVSLSDLADPSPFSWIETSLTEQGFRATSKFNCLRGVGWLL